MYEQMPPNIIDIDYVIKYTPNPDPNVIINQIFKGVDIILVDPQVYPQILQPLHIFKDIFKQNGQNEMVKKCDFLIDYITEYPNRQRLSRLLMNRPPSPPPKPPALSPDEVNKIVDDLLETDEINFFPQEELELILAELRKRRAAYQEKGDYINAEKADHYTKAILNYGQLGAVEMIQNEKVAEIKTKLRESETQLEKDRKKWEDLYENLKQQAIDDLTKINNQYEEKIDKMIKGTQPDENGVVNLPPAFRKPSAELLQLKRRQKAMIGSKKLNDAADVKDKIEELEKQERLVQEQNYREYIAGRIESKRVEQRKTLMMRKNYWKQQEDALVKEANADVEKSEMAIEHIKKNLKEAEHAHKLATSLKKNTKSQSQTASQPKNKGLPPLANKFANSRNAAQEYRQRMILNSKIYTRSVSKSSPVTVRNRKK